uniref:Tetraspanin n=1 Tax=Kalanchoe fedtschenkoi TaxID=63787 RepID=A0A7N0TJA6_KALFE
MASSSSCTCRIIFCVLSGLSLLISIPIIWLGVSMRKGSQSKCDTDVYPHMLVEGIAMLILSLIAIIGVAKRIRLLIWLFMALTIFEFTYILIGSASGFHWMYTERGRQAHYWDHEDVYTLDHFREDVKNHYLNSVAWAGHKSCFRHVNLCSNEYDSNLTSWKATNPIRYACCGPPVHCGYTYVDGKGFEVPRTGLASHDPDCVAYDNHGERRCFDCDMCKVAFLVIEVGDLQRLNMAVIIVNVMFTLQLMMACSAMETISYIDDGDINNPVYRRYRH